MVQSIALTPHPDSVSPERWSDQLSGLCELCFPEALPSFFSQREIPGEVPVAQ